MIDKVDNKLGDVNKEISFDKFMIGLSIGIIAVEIVFLALCSAVPALQVPAIVGAVLCALALFILPVMVKELKDDKQKAKRG